jgi:hypothetical protein
MMDEINKKEHQLLEVSSHMEEVRMNYEAQAGVLGRAKELQHQYLNELCEKEKEIQRLKVSLDQIQNTQGVVNDMKAELVELRVENVDLKDKFDKMVSSPFFDYKSDKHSSRANKLEIELEALQTASKKNSE